MKKLMLKIMGSMAMMSLCIATLSANSTSNWFVHQPKIPGEIKKLKKRS